jgi:hypothetical protein
VPRNKAKKHRKTKAEVERERMAAEAQAAREARLDALESACKSQSNTMKCDWDTMFECGLIEEIVDDCDNHFAELGVPVQVREKLLVCVIFCAHDGWNHAIAWAQQRVEEALM